MTHAISRHLLVAAAAGSALALSFASSAFAEVKLTFLVDNAPATVKASEALAAAFHAENPDITVEVESRPGGGEGDNIVKTRLATGEMTDVFMYNTGSLFHALNPQQNMLDLTGESYQSDIMDTFKSVVSENGKIYGAPFRTTMGGGVLYNKKIYAELGLKVPKTWAEFMQNNAVIKEKSKAAPVIQTFKDTWTSQLFFLGDFYNVLQAVADLPGRLHGQQGEVRHDSGCHEGLRASGGSVQGRLPQRGLRVGELRRRPAHGLDGRRRPLSDADLRHRQPL